MDEITEEEHHEECDYPHFKCRCAYLHDQDAAWHDDSPEYGVWGSQNQ